MDFKKEHQSCSNDNFPLEENEEKRKEIDNVILNFANEFLNTISETKAFNNSGQNKTKQDNLFEIGKETLKLENILGLIKERVVDTGLNPASGGNFGYIPGGGIYSSALGDYLAAVTNRYAGIFYASPGAVRMEDALIKWVGNLIGYSKGFGGNLTSGGSIANLIALSTAKKSKNITSKNLLKSVIYCSTQTHHSIYKAINIVGLEECVLRQIPLDSDFRISTFELKSQIKKDVNDGLKPFLAIANAGSTDVGAIDPLEKLSAICREYSIWFHVDAAYGGFFAMTTYGKNKLYGLKQADSVILDPHKGMFLPYGSGMLLVKDINHLLNTNKYSANYMQDAEKEMHYSPSDLSPEMSKHFRGLRMWLPLKLYGVDIFSDYLEEKLRLTIYLCKELRQLGFTIVCEPDLTIIAFRFNFKDRDNEALNTALLNHILEDGRVFISSTILDSQFTLRAAILSFRTHKKETDLLVYLLKSKLEDL
ncbi:aminotransferase class I/II-fold pyridoxal phosphate-dependent enzyme [Cellulophaga sp. F20128]|uniref:pyridoxal phosphate-dependent decarboxylase family protein n=1 Tax=Cellulophaga sp. F20128 TaxID=2926413 RepID=UPI001FF6F1BA|nr:aminotransferase class I/II-fold pyridoxal phosphate-dependent enzyme [Cellulophaga sp. F20128]MCK0157252.1 aminotransferase class I/II-fold pyridoxal phosphate-dependent enzyme [Cellulophaga sp. F20128]